MKQKSVELPSSGSGILALNLFSISRTSFSQYWQMSGANGDKKGMIYHHSDLPLSSTLLTIADT